MKNVQNKVRLDYFIESYQLSNSKEQQLPADPNVNTILWRFLAIPILDEIYNEIRPK